jgi:23S rRNA pseudouridine1911/1915/1917 synthase
VVVHPAAGHRGETLVHHLLHYLKNDSAFREISEDRPGIVHRLDRGTSGVLLVAKNRAVQENLSRQFKHRTIKKEYECVCWGVPRPEGTVDTPIGRDTRDRKKMSSRTASGRAALTRWKTHQAFRHFAHLALFPHTGRTHQLRVHLAESGFPIVGDALYGRARRPILPPRVTALVDATSETYLHARRLTLLHPTRGESMTLEAHRPGVFEAFLQLLRKDDA